MFFKSTNAHLRIPATVYMYMLAFEFYAEK